MPFVNDTRATKKAPVKSAILIDHNQFNYLAIKNLLTYAKPREHSPQHLLRSNLPTNLPDMVQGLAYVLRYEFRGDSSEEGFAGAGEGFQGFLEGLEVAEVGDEGGGGVGCVGDGGGGEGCGDFGQAEAVAGADG